MTDRETIQSALEKVHSGQLTPAQATEILLAAEQAAEHQVTTVERETTADSRETDGFESLASLIGRLGEPPGDIVEAWCGQLRRIAADVERETGEPLPAIELADWSVTPRGTLAHDGRVFDRATDDKTPQLSPVSVERIEQFRESLLPGTVTFSPPLDAQTSPTDAETDCGAEATERAAAGEDSRQPARRSLARKALVVGVTAASLAIAAVVLYRETHPEVTAEVDAPDTNRADPVLADATSAGGDSDPTIGIPPESTGTLETLETLESVSESELATIESTAVNLEPSFSLDDVMPPVAGFVEAAGLAEDPAPASRDNADTVEAVMEDEDAQAALANGDAAPDESPQSTRTSSVMSVALAATDDDGQSTVLADRRLNKLNLEFPFDVPLELAGEDGDWEICDTRDSTLVGRITSDPAQTSFRWTDSAATSPAALALTHGRITDGGGSTFFLRPVVEADPWPIRLNESDVMPSWNLRYPIPPRVARASFAFDLPEEIEHAWIEPIEAEALRRTRGLAVLTPKDDNDSVALGMRFDLRCNRKLSCRVRFAARLDPSMPWQIVSAPMLEQSADQLVAQATWISQQATRLAAAYENADASARKTLRIHRDRNEALGETVRTASERVAQLQALIARLEAAGSLKIRVWVEWPDSSQEILSMESADTEDDDADQAADQAEVDQQE